MSESFMPSAVPEDLKSYLRIPAADTSKDSLLMLLLESCTLAAERYIGRYIIARSITEEPHDFYNAKSKYLQLMTVMVYYLMELQIITSQLLKTEM